MLEWFDTNDVEALPVTMARDATKPVPGCGAHDVTGRAAQR